jgi:D-alanine-D-alanine ligase
LKKIAVLKGGRSAEREVSLTTGAAVAEGLRSVGYEVVEIDAAAEDLCARLSQCAPDVVFIALHGRWGEDGSVQGLLEMMQLPYTGSGVVSSAVAIDKVISKTIFAANGVPTPQFQVLAPECGAEEIALLPPYVIKPPREGSTIGISVVTDAGEAPAAVVDARQYDKELLVESFVEGRELTVSVLDGRTLPIVEIEPESGFYNYESKYTAGSTRYTCPARLDEELAAQIDVVAQKAYRVLDCSGAARVDVLLDGENRPWVLEVNTIPGMTPTSLLPKAAAADGMDFGALVDAIVKTASLKIGK